MQVNPFSQSDNPRWNLKKQGKLKSRHWISKPVFALGPSMLEPVGSWGPDFQNLEAFCAVRRAPLASEQANSIAETFSVFVWWKFLSSDFGWVSILGLDRSEHFYVFFCRTGTPGEGRVDGLLRILRVAVGIEGECLVCFWWDTCYWIVLFGGTPFILYSDFPGIHKNSW